MIYMSIQTIWNVKYRSQTLSLKPVERNTAHANVLVKSLQQNVVIDSVKSCAANKQQLKCDLLRVHVQKNIIYHFQQGCFRTVVLAVRWLELGI